MIHSIGTQSAQGKSNETGSKVSSELIEVNQVGKTPFVTIKRDGKGFVAIGQRRLTDELEPKELEKKCKGLEKIDWEFMISVLGAIVEQCFDAKEQEALVKAARKEVYNGDKES